MASVHVLLSALPWSVAMVEFICKNTCPSSRKVASRVMGPSVPVRTIKASPFSPVAEVMVHSIVAGNISSVHIHPLPSS